jgi:hypothetical protein
MNSIDGGVLTPNEYYTCHVEMPAAILEFVPSIDEVIPARMAYYVSSLFAHPGKQMGDPLQNEQSS